MEQFLKMKQRTDILSNWQSNNPVLDKGEIGFISDTNEFKIGNGKDDFKKLKTFKQSGTLVGKIDTTLDANNDGEVFNDYVYNKASGLCSHAEGGNTTASGDYSHVEGWCTTASGHYGSHAEGQLTTAGGYSSHAEGCSTTASGNDSHAEGGNTTASGYYGSHAEGYYTEASGYSSHAQNKKTIANGFAQTAIGYKNIPEPAPSVDSFDPTKLAFVVGGGSQDGNKNIFEVYFNGNTKQAGTSEHPQADYAEMFEWADGNVNAEDRIGRFVTMDGEKIKLADKSSKYILGAISAAPVILGNEPMEWHGKYIDDEWGRPQYMDHEFQIERSKKDRKTGEVKKELITKKQRTRTVSQNYDETLKYIPRKDRKEWDAVGMLGKLRVLQDGTLKAGGFCYPSKDGIATDSKSGYYVMKVLNSNQALIIIK